MTLISFLVVFRTSQAVSRFNRGSSLLATMTSDFFNAASYVTSLSRASKRGQDERRVFLHTVTRVFSALNQLCQNELGQREETERHELEGNLIDVRGIDE